MRLYSIELIVRQDSADQPPYIDVNTEVENGIPEEVVRRDSIAVLRNVANQIEHDLAHQMGEDHTHEDNNTRQKGDTTQ